ncbi:hypothetical protein C5Y96_05825 [Blastopirellula marina]|uniref:Uncharacterized protein n=1 Tax=Blastopirellula marina TaxID=124 RepID=A0A2S8G4J1_9BACT|nr:MULTISPECIES: hypothetical protein [Pirellulaceae]PQO39372.1 hypothetical protein C5Y96_05825 [Blastopirellula marina]RCS55680.1 hypothetical protein DTL36_05835 [Bremerella cremea]
MQTAALNLETLAQLDPELAELYAELLTEAVQDCKARPHLQKARTVVLSLSMVPVEDDPEDVCLEWNVGLKTPSSVKTRNPKRGPVRARRSKTDQLQFDF